MNKNRYSHSCGYNLNWNYRKETKLGDRMCVVSRVWSESLQNSTKLFIFLVNSQNRNIRKNENLANCGYITARAWRHGRARLWCLWCEYFSYLIFAWSFFSRFDFPQLVAVNLLHSKGRFPSDIILSFVQFHIIITFEMYLNHKRIIGTMTGIT